MRKVLTITALLMAALLVFSCANGGGSDSDNSPVKVSFNVETPHEDIAKIASVDTPAADFTYWYKAVPQWTGADFTAIQGSTNNAFVEITDYEDGKDIGLFAQGSWKFWAQVKVDGVVLYESAAEPAVTYINATTHSVTLDVTRTTNGSATVSIDIEVPLVSAATVLTAAYNGGTVGLTKTTMESASNKPTHGAGWARFKGTSSALASGSYLFTLTSNDGTNDVGGAVLAFDIIPGVNRTITGTIENGVWQTTLITINVPTLTVNLTGSATATVGTPQTYTCTATTSNLAQGDTVTYQWYEDKNATPSATGATYSYNPTSAGYHYVKCKAEIAGKLVASKTLAVTVNPAP